MTKTAEEGTFLSSAIFLKERLKMIDAGTILQKIKKQAFRYVISFAAEGLYFFENDDIDLTCYFPLANPRPFYCIVSDF